MEKLRQQARDLGIVFSQDAANAAADFKDAQNELKSAVLGVTFAIGKELAPHPNPTVALHCGKYPHLDGKFAAFRAEIKPLSDVFITMVGIVILVMGKLFKFVIAGFLRQIAVGKTLVEATKTAWNAIDNCIQCGHY